MEVGLSIAQMQRGMDVEGFYLLKAAFAKVTASGKPFLSAVLADTSGTIEAKVWDYSGPIGERDVGKVLKGAWERIGLPRYAPAHSRQAAPRRRQ